MFEKVFQTRQLPASCILLAAIFSGLPLPAHAANLPFGKKDKEATVKITRGSGFKDQSTFALGSFRVAFVTEDSALSTSHGVFANGGSAAKIFGRLDGIDHTRMQKIADEVYADFLKQAAAKGYTILDSTRVAASSPAYNATTKTPDFTDSRIGVLVIPTGQTSVALAADDSPKDSKGVAGMSSAFHNLGKQLAVSEANKVFPVVSKEVNAPVLGVTIVVNFANFKGTSSSFGSSKATVLPGATIDGTNNVELALFTAILAFDTKEACDHAGCNSSAALVGQIHSDAPIGKSSKSHEGSGWITAQKTIATVDADPDLYETNVLEVSTEAIDLLLSAIAKEK